MIESDRRYPFGSKVTRITTPVFAAMVSTAKEGLFSKQSMMIFDVSNGTHEPVGKIMWSSAMRSEDRLNMHDRIVAALNSMGDNGTSLADCIEFVVGKIRPTGMIESAINLT